jgi:glycosyltransferase involved in cell wall biosynthesis
VLAAMELFAFTSVEKDTSPLTLLSAMAAGLPIVAFDIEGVRELVAEGAQLLLAPLRDANALGELLLRLISEPELRRRLSDGARRQAIDRFSLERHVASMEQVFAEVYQQARAAIRQRILDEFPLAKRGQLMEQLIQPLLNAA